MSTLIALSSRNQNRPFLGPKLTKMADEFDCQADFTRETGISKPRPSRSLDRVIPGSGHHSACAASTHVMKSLTG